MPYQLLLNLRYKKNTNGPWQSSFCGGTLITLVYAISAYSCFNTFGIRVHISSHTVYAGRYLWKIPSTSENVQVSDYYIQCTSLPAWHGLMGF